MKRFIESIQNNFAILLQSGAWLLSVLSAFIFPPPVAFSNNSEFLFRFVQFLVTACIGLMIFPMKKFSLKRHAFAWWLLAFIILAASIIVFINYNSSYNKYTVRFPFGTENKAVIGTQMKPEILAVKLEEKITDEELIAGYGIGSEDEFDKIWEKEGIEENRNHILILYISSVICFTLFVIVLVQSIKCLNRTRK